MLICEINMGATAIGTGITAPSGVCGAGLPAAGRDNRHSADDLAEPDRGDAGLRLVRAALGRVEAGRGRSCRRPATTCGCSRAARAPASARSTCRRCRPAPRIMPGKVNPVIPEVVNQIAFEVIGNDMTVSFAAEAGQLQLNAFEPIIAHSLFKSVAHLRPGCLTLEARCVAESRPTGSALRSSVERSIGIVTALNPYIGYANATAVAQEAHASGRSVQEIVVEKGLLSKEKLAEILRPEILTRPQPNSGSRRCGARRRGGGHDGHRRGCTRDVMQGRSNAVPRSLGDRLPLRKCERSSGRHVA